MIIGERKKENGREKTVIRKAMTNYENVAVEMMRDQFSDENTNVRQGDASLEIRRQQ